MHSCAIMCKLGSAEQLSIQPHTGKCIKFTTAIACHWNVGMESIQQKNENRRYVNAVRLERSQ